MKRLIAAGIATGVLFIVGCSGGGYGTVTGQVDTTSFNGNPGGATPPSAPSGNTALFNLSTGQLPFPTDLYFAGSTDGTLNIQPPNAVWPNQQFLNALDGFSTTAAIREQFGGPLDPTSFTPASVIVIPVITDNLTKATTGVLGPPLVPGTDYTAALATDTGVGPQILEITPLHPLMPSTCISNGQSLLPNNCTKGTGYLVILTNGIKDASGNAAKPDTQYADILAALKGGPTCPSITDKTLNGVCQLTGAHLQIAQALGLNPANIVLTFSFTTESTADTLEALSAVTQPQAIAVQHPPGFTTAVIPGLGLPGHADLYVGVLTIPYYLSASDPINEYWKAPPFPLDKTSTYTTRFNPLPVATAMLKIPVLLSVPNASSAMGATPPANGWPVVVFQHGITRSREDMFGLADSFADSGTVVVAIDLPLHGVTSTADPLYASAANPLYAGLGLPANQMSIERTFDLDLENNTTMAPGADGKIDPSGSHFINLANPLNSRDNNREGAADLITLVRSIAAASGTLLGAAGKIDPTRIHYVGHSLGAIIGTTFLAVATPSDVSTATLAMPGGKLTQLLLDSPTFGPVINAGLEAKGLMPGTTLYAQFNRDVQTIIDAGDPINFIALATLQHPVHMLQVVGTPPGDPKTQDQVIPNSATQRLITASAYPPPGLPAAALTRVPAPAAPGPVSNANGLRVYVNFTQGDHGSIIDDKVPAVTAEMQGEAITFTGAALPPIPALGFPGFPATPAGTTILILNPIVIQGP
jgi:pimeloyl-ACP methyl ester carboxylesterase